MATYFVAVDDQQKGPFTLEQIKDQVKNGEIQKSSLMWRDGLSEWQSAEQVLMGTGVVFSAPAPGQSPPPLISTGDDVRVPGADLPFGVPAAVVDAGRGISWIGEGWGLFKAAPGLWILALVIFLVIQIVLGMIPVIGSVASILLGPSFIVGILAFAHGIASGEQADIGKLFVGFKDKLGALVVVGLLYFVMLMAVMVIAVLAVIVLIGGAALSSVTDPAQFLQSALSGGGLLAILLGVLLMLSLMMLVAAAYWYAPGLVFYANVGAVDAMKQSFSACLRNWLPFLLYGLVGLVVLFLGALPFGLGLIVALPVLMASYYASFRDIFGRNS